MFANVDIEILATIASIVIALGAVIGAVVAVKNYRYTPLGTIFMYAVVGAAVASTAFFAVVYFTLFFVALIVFSGIAFLYMKNKHSRA